MHIVLRRTAVLLFVLSAGLYAQEVPEERVLFLIPIVAEKVPGGFGSIWSTEVVAFNASGTEKLIRDRCIGLCLVQHVPPGEAVNVRLFERDGGAYFIHTDRRSVTLQARVFDESRQELNWGTHLPVVEWDAVKGNEFWFVRVPAVAPFRHTVRAFGGLDSGENTFRVRYYDANTSELLAERTETGFHDPAWHSSDIPEIAGRESVRIQVSSQSPIWAMVSVTNEETQFVTILPGRAVQPQP